MGLAGAFLGAAGAFLGAAGALLGVATGTISRRRCGARGEVKLRRMAVPLGSSVCGGGSAYTHKPMVTLMVPHLAQNI